MGLEQFINEYSKDDIKKELARKKHVRFMQYCWQKPSEPFIVGMHTRIICGLIDKAMEDFRKGKSTFLCIKVPFRHGKSDMLSRYAPPHFLGEFPDCDVMSVTYAMGLAEGFSRFARNIIRESDAFAELYPDIEISHDNGGVHSWGIEGHTGVFTASGLTSGITGKGYHLGLLDDYCAGRADAESEGYRNGSWEHFTNDFLTRRAPTSITVVLATPWHVDDIIGRIEQKIDPNSDSYDPVFPPFKVVTLPAMNGVAEERVMTKGSDGKIHETYKKTKYDYLFLERFSAEWYEQQYASLGEYNASGLLQCNPQTRGGNLFNCDSIKIHDKPDEFPKTKYYRVWDLAHTEKQTQKADPDWTSGTLLTYTKKVENGITKWELWIKDVQRIRAKAPERDTFIRAVTDKDGMAVTVAVENSMDSKDAVSTMQVILNGSRVIRPLNIRYDKVARAGFVEPIFDGGNVHIMRGEWNLDWLKEVKEFPSAKHDDQVDNFTAGYFLCCEGNNNIVISRTRY